MILPRGLIGQFAWLANVATTLRDAPFKPQRLDGQPGPHDAAELYDWEDECGRLTNSEVHPNLARPSALWGRPADRAIRQDRAWERPEEAAIHAAGDNQRIPCRQVGNHEEKTMSSIGYHEPVEDLSAETRDMHRAIVSLMEELEAVDWYEQRAAVCTNSELKTILQHNRDEEKEHAAMLLGWIRRRDTKFSDEIKDHLLTEKPIAEA